MNARLRVHVGRASGSKHVRDVIRFCHGCSPRVVHVRAPLCDAVVVPSWCLFLSHSGTTLAASTRTPSVPASRMPCDVHARMSAHVCHLICRADPLGDALRLARELKRPWRSTQHLMSFARSCCCGWGSSCTTMRARRISLQPYLAFAVLLPSQTACSKHVVGTLRS